MGFSGRAVPNLSNFPWLLARLRLLLSEVLPVFISVAAVIMLNSFQLFFVYVTL